MKNESAQDLDEKMENLTDSPSAKDLAIDNEHLLREEL